MWSIRSSAFAKLPISKLPFRKSNFSTAPALKVGDEIHGYKVLRTTEIPELAICATHLKHQKSAAEHLHLARDDDNNCFNVVFRTTPNDNTGVAHILEHMVLCGSEKFPCRDPFMKMTTRSLATFLNAMTWPDATSYPFSSTNPKDFANLMDVYLDAVFYPKLRPFDFLQEAWRVSREKSDDQNSPLKIKGVVYNEMKGAFSSPGQIYYRSLLNNLFPDTTYQHESGGDPLDIPKLTHEQLKKFYATYYHPSNARFMTYGNFPLESHLKLINERVLSRFDADIEARNRTSVSLQSSWNESRSVNITCAPDPFAANPAKQTTISVSFLLPDLKDVFQSFVLSIVSNLLISGPTSPFYESLIISGLGTDYSPGTGFLNFTRQSGFSVGVQGASTDDAEKIQKVVEQTLAQAAIDGFPDERFEALLHQIEISLKHVTSNFGINMSYSMNPVLNHDADSFESLRTSEAVDKLRDLMKSDPNYLKNQIREHFLDNKHRLALIMSPDENYMSKLQAKEEELTKSIVDKLSDEEKEQLHQTEAAMLQFVSTPDDGSILPCLDVEKDISREFKGYVLNHHKLHDVPVQTSIQKTNGLNYVKLFFPIDKFDSQLLPYLPIFSSFVSKMGAGTASFKEMDLQIRNRTGGIHSGLHSSDDKVMLGKYEKGILLSTSCLHRNDTHMYKLLQDIICEPLFGKEKDYLKQLIRMTATDMSSSIADAGNAYALSRASSHLLASAKFKETVSGLDYVSFLSKISQMEDIDDLVCKLDQIRQSFMITSNLRASLNTDSSSAEDKNLNLLQQMLSCIPKGDPLANANASADETSAINVDKIHREHHILNINSNYVGKAVTTVPFCHEDYAPLNIASKLMSSKFLLREIREIGGAYGARATSSPNLFTFSTYRDPNTDRTLEKFEESAKWLASGDFTDQAIMEAKLGAFQLIDRPIPPESVGSLPFLQNVTYEERHAYRLALLNVTKDDLVRVAKKYLVGRQSGTSFAILGPPDSNPRIAWERIEH